MRPVFRLRLTPEFSSAAAQDLNHDALKDLNDILVKYDAEIKRTFDALQETVTGKSDAYDHWNDVDKVIDAAQNYADDQASYDVFITTGDDEFDRLTKGTQLEAELRRHPVFKTMVP